MLFVARLTYELKRLTRVGGTVRKATRIAAGAALFSRLLAVNLIPVITNDSVGYLSHAQDVFDDGLVWAGYRQIGYPAFLSTTKVIGTALGIEPVLFTAVFQRLLLGLALAYAIWLFRWFALPLVVVASAPDIVAYTNLILTEGVAIPLAILYGTLLGHIALSRMRGRFPRAKLLPFGSFPRTSCTSTRKALFVAAAVLLVLMTLIKYQSIAFSFPLFVLLWLEARGGQHRRFAIALTLSTLTVLTVLSGIMALENQSEYDDLFPISRGIRNGYWGTYQLVFNLYPENRDNPILEPYYADGNTFSFIRYVESTFDTYPDQRLAFEGAITEMLDQADLNRRDQQLVSSWEGLRGGRFDDIASIIGLVRTSSTVDVDKVIHKNAVASKRGIDKYVAGYNDAQRIEPVLTSALFRSGLNLSARSMIRWTGPIAILVLLIAGLQQRSERYFFIAGMAGALAVFVLVGSLLVDNYRYVVTAHSYLLALATAAVVVTWDEISGSPRGINA